MSTIYTKHGKGPRRLLRFTKTGEPRLEKLYARHFVWPGKVPFHLPRPRTDGPEPIPAHEGAAPVSGSRRA